MYRMEHVDVHEQRVQQHLQHVMMEIRIPLTILKMVSVDVLELFVSHEFHVMMEMKRQQMI